MASVKIKDDVLKMAIAQIAYRSRDLNHLDYEVFLKRFLEEGKWYNFSNIDDVECRWL